MVYYLFLYQLTYFNCSSFDIWYCFFLFQDCLSHSTHRSFPLYFYINFTNSLSISTNKKIRWDFYWDCLESIDEFGENILTMLHLWIPYSWYILSLLSLIFFSFQCRDLAHLSLDLFYMSNVFGDLNNLLFICLLF